MRVLFAIKNLDLGGGGAERVLVQVAGGLAGRGHEVGILTFDAPGGTSFYPLDGRIRRMAVGIAPTGESQRAGALIAGLPRIRHQVARFVPDVAVPFMHSTYVPVAIALARSGVPVVLSEHAPAAHYQTRPMQRLLAAAAGRLAVAKTVPSDFLVGELPSARDWVHVVPNPVDVDVFSAAARTPPASPPILLAVGRFRPEKNFSELVRAFAEIAPRFPGWSLRLVGDGEERSAIETEIARLGLRDRIVLAGMVQDTATEYAAASVVAIPSQYESFGLVAAEALASARPVVSFDRCRGVARIVTDGRSGLLVNSADTPEGRVTNLAAGLARLMGDPELRCRLGRAGPSSVDRFRLERVVGRWEAFLGGIVARYGRHAGLKTASRNP